MLLLSLMVLLRLSILSSVRLRGVEAVGTDSGSSFLSEFCLVLLRSFLLGSDSLLLLALEFLLSVVSLLAFTDELDSVLDAVPLLVLVCCFFFFLALPFVASVVNDEALLALVDVDDT